MWKQYLEEEAKLNLKPKVGIYFIMVQWNQHVIEVCMATRCRKQKWKKEKVKLEKVSRMKRQGMKCEKGKFIDESWNIQVRDDSLRKIFENQLAKPMARLLNGQPMQASGQKS